MCSNCSGDDLRPESFATFDVSSPERMHGFAGHAGAKRKRYGTSGILAKLSEAALTQAIIHLWERTADSEIIEKVDRSSFVNLNSAAASDESARKTRVPIRSR